MDEKTKVRSTGTGRSTVIQPSAPALSSFATPARVMFRAYAPDCVFGSRPLSLFQHRLLPFSQRARPGLEPGGN